MTPVISIALFCFWQTPKAPSSEAAPKMIKHTKAQDIARFCMPAIKTVITSLHQIKILPIALT